MSQKDSQKPYALFGAGPLTATVWKSGCEDKGWNYAFVITRMNQKTGSVTQRFRLADVLDLAKLLKVMAFDLADDGCLAPEDREELYGFACRLRTALAAAGKFGESLN